jgi:hypothetical protein
MLLDFLTVLNSPSLETSLLPASFRSPRRGLNPGVQEEVVATDKGALVVLFDFILRLTEREILLSIPASWSSAWRSSRAISPIIVTPLVAKFSSEIGMYKTTPLLGAT